jgi:hypothetical protein
VADNKLKDWKDSTKRTLMECPEMSLFVPRFCRVANRIKDAGGLRSGLPIAQHEGNAPRSSLSQSPPPENYPWAMVGRRRAHGGVAALTEGSRDVPTRSAATKGHSIDCLMILNCRRSALCLEPLRNRWSLAGCIRLPLGMLPQIEQFLSGSAKSALGPCGVERGEASFRI